MKWAIMALGASALSAICTVIAGFANQKQTEDRVREEVKKQLNEHDE